LLKSRNRRLVKDHVTPLFVSVLTHQFPHRPVGSVLFIRTKPKSGRIEQKFSSAADHDHRAITGSTTPITGMVLVLIAGTAIPGRRVQQAEAQLRARK
jgi:hypothetical protein